MDEYKENLLEQLILSGLIDTNHEENQTWTFPKSRNFHCHRCASQSML